MNSFLKPLSLMACMTTLISCTVLQPIDKAQLRTALHHGDQVQVTTTSGQQLQFTVDEVNDQGLRGDGQTVPFANIQGVSRKQIAAGRTALMVLGAVAVGAAAASGGGSGGGGGY